MNKLRLLKIRSRRYLIVPFLGLVLGMQLLVSNAEAYDFNEYRVKSAFVLNFIAFTQWPSGIDQNLNLCIYGEDHFGQEIDNLHKRTVGKNSIKIVRLSSLKKSKECQVLFISKSVVKSLPNILASIQDESVLTIADSPGTAEVGVIINMNLVQNKITIEVNLESAHSAKLKISSKLLQLATDVYQ